MKRSRPRGVRSDVEVSATRLPFITRMPTERCPASSTSSGSPSRTWTESSEPERAIDLGDVGAALLGALHELGERRTRAAIRRSWDRE